MSNDTDKVGDGRGDPDVSEVEALLRELDVDDLVRTAPPASVWTGISETIATDPAPVVAIDSRRALRRSWIWASAAAVMLIVVGFGAIADR